MPKNITAKTEINLDNEFQRIYDLVSDAVADGDIHEIVFEDIDRVLMIIWNSEDSTGALYESLKTDGDKENFIVDFRSAAEWLMGWNKDDLTEDQISNLAHDILSERSRS